MSIVGVNEEDVNEEEIEGRKAGGKNGRRFYDMTQQVFNNNESWSFKS